MRLSQTILACVVAASLVTGCAKSEAKSESGLKKYGVKSGIIEYELSGTQSGTETVYFDRWGMREARYSDQEIRVMGFTQKTKQMALMEDEWITTVDLKNNTATKIKNPMWDDLVEGKSEKDLQEFGEEMMRQMGGEKTGTEKILGKKCDVWEVSNMGTKTWIWKGIPLKTEVNMMGMSQNTTAVSIDENASIPESKFAVNVEVQSAVETPQVNMEQLQGMMKGLMGGE